MFGFARTISGCAVIASIKTGVAVLSLRCVRDVIKEKITDAIKWRGHLISDGALDNIGSRNKKERERETKKKTVKG